MMVKRIAALAVELAVRLVAERIVELVDYDAVYLRRYSIAHLSSQYTA